MTVGELKAFLADKNDSLEVYTSRWTHHGEVRQRMRLSRKDGNRSPGGTLLRVSWTDDCRADTISEIEWKTGAPGSS